MMMESKRHSTPIDDNNNGYATLNNDREIEYERERCHKKYPAEILDMLASYTNSLHEKKIAFVSLQHNSESILPHLIASILQAIHYLGSDNNLNVFVSFLESNSNDETVQILREFEDKLNQLGVRNSIKTNDNSINPIFQPGCIGTSCRNRIDYLARLRNVAMAPLFELNDNEGLKFDNVVFINDVILCGGDILRLLARSTIDNADMVCGYDFEDKIFWDNWVYEDMDRIDDASDKRNKRDIIIDSNLHPKAPSPLKEPNMETPESVFCCWNGMAVINMDVFYNGVRFRRGMMELGTESDCSQSEASLLCLDMRKLGYNSIIADPTVQVFYDTTARDFFSRYTSEENSKSLVPMNYDAYSNKRESWRCCELMGNGQTHIDRNQCRQQRLDEILSTYEVNKSINNSSLEEAQDILLYTTKEWDDTESNSWRFPFSMYTGSDVTFNIHEEKFSTISTEQNIPKVIFQTCKSYHNAPKRIVELVTSWSNVNPTYRHYVLDDGAAEKFILKHYNDTVLEAFRNVPLGVMRGDMIRYMLLYEYGGIYADIDTQSLTPIDEWTPVGCNFVMGQENEVHFLQWAFASVPKHPLLKSVIDLMLDRVINKKYDPLTNEHFVHATTGPGVWTEGIHNYIRGKDAPDEGTYTGLPIESTDVCIYSRDDMDSNFKNIYMSAATDLSTDGTSGLWNSWTKEREQLINQMQTEKQRTEESTGDKRQQQDINDEPLLRRQGNNTVLANHTPGDIFENAIIPDGEDGIKNRNDSDWSSMRTTNHDHNRYVTPDGSLSSFSTFLSQSAFFLFLLSFISYGNCFWRNSWKCNENSKKIVEVAT